MTPGYHKLSADKYLADPCVVPSLNATVAVILLRESARKAWFSHPRLNPNFRQREDAKFDLGKAAHAMLLEGEDIIEVCDFDDWRKKEAREKRDAARAAGKTPLLKKNSGDVRAMVETANEFIAQSEIAEPWQDAESELTGIVLEDGVWLRCRFDRIGTKRRFIADYKSTEDVSPEVFSRQITRMNYHIQEAFYRRVARDLGATGPRFVFLAQSAEAPYECALHACTPELQEIGDAEVERAIHLWRIYSKTKEWPSYGGSIHYALPSSWQIHDHEIRMASERVTA